MMTDDFIRKLDPVMADRFLTVVEQIAALPQAERDCVLDSALDVLDPLPELRSHSNAAKVADARAFLASLEAQPC